MKLTHEERQILCDMFESREWELEDDIEMTNDKDEKKDFKEELKILLKLREKVLSSE
jgi:hypothetical protein